MHTSLSTRRWRPDWRLVAVAVAAVVALVAVLAIAIVVSVLDYASASIRQRIT